MSATVYLVRHGQSEWNVLRLTQGQTAHPRLTDVGLDQARVAAAVLADELAEGGRRVRVITSDLTRARETAEIIAERLDAELVEDIRLREQHLGELEGKSYDETWAMAELHDWSNPNLPIAGGESLQAVRDRIVMCLDELSPDRIHVLVSHGDAIRAAVAHRRGETPHEASWVDVPNGAVARISEDIQWLT